MDLPAVQFLCLEQKDRSLEDHKRDFLDLACLTRHSTPLAGSSFPLAPPSSSVTPAPPWSSGSLPSPQSTEPSAPPRPLPTSWTARSVFFTSPAWASNVRHACQRTVPKRKILPLSWSGCWRTMDFHSPSAPQRRISPAPLPNHRPASRHPAAQSYTLSPPQLSQSLPQSLCLKHHLTMCVSRQHRLSPREFWWWLRAWREASLTLPQLMGSCIWFLGVLKRNSWTFSRWT